MFKFVWNLMMKLIVSTCTLSALVTLRTEFFLFSPLRNSVAPYKIHRHLIKFTDTLPNSLTPYYIHGYLTNVMEIEYCKCCINKRWQPCLPLLTALLCYYRSKKWKHLLSNDFFIMHKILQNSKNQQNDRTTIETRKNKIENYESLQKRFFMIYAWNINKRLMRNFYYQTGWSILIIPSQSIETWPTDANCSHLLA